MNKAWILFNLREARESLGNLIKEIESDPEYGYGDYVIDVTHIYHHINTSWNGRDATYEEANQCSEEDFYEWRQFPSTDEIYLGR